MTKTRDQIIQEIMATWPPHLRDEFIILGETCSTLDGNFSRNELRMIEVGMTTLAVRLKLEGEPEEGEPEEDCPVDSKT